MQRVLSACLGLCLALGVAGGASAGFGVPHGTEVCGTTQMAAELPDPNGLYAGIGKPALCEKLCKKTEQACRAGVKDGMACVLRVVRFNFKFNLVYCDSEFEGQEERDCRENAEEFWLEGVPFLKANRQLYLDDCADWGDACRATSCD